MICKKCGTEFKEGIFCPECGQKYEEEVIKKVSEDKETLQDASEQKKEKMVKPPINWKARFSLVLGIISFLTAGVLIIPEILGFALGIISKKGEQKYKKTALWGIGLSIISAIIAIIVFIAMSSETSTDTNIKSEVVEQVVESNLSEERQVESIQLEETAQTETIMENYGSDEYSDLLNKYTMEIYLTGEDTHMTSYEMDLYIDGQVALADAYEGDALFVTLELSQGNHSLNLVRYGEDEKVKSNTISFEVSPAYTNELYVSVELKEDGLQYVLAIEKDNDEAYVGYTKYEENGQKIVRTASGKKIYYNVEFWVRRESLSDEDDRIEEPLTWETQEVFRRESAVAPEIPTFDDYEFEGWSEDFSCVEKDMKVYADYKFVEKDEETDFPGVYVNGQNKIEIIRVTNKGVYFNLDAVHPDTGKEIHLKNQKALGKQPRLIYSFKGSGFGLEDENLAFIPNHNGIEATSIYIQATYEHFLGGFFEKESESLDQSIESNVSEGDYILPMSDQRYLREDDVATMNGDMIRLAINEIYARHGRIFQAEDLKTYFESKDWYVPKYNQEEFVVIEESELNDYEKKNIQFLAKKREQLQ